ncbi:hypothetical protein OG787_46785 [Streptomyces sp. NBC_00075]|uniref:hypothetical protein n=1 Tax=Streptomyces sp. NBC_00075 TaxID=2975641 RepID=UPI00324E2DED
MRAVLHASFAIPLTSMCLRREDSHPGFVVLDSPLATDREPGMRDADLPDGVMQHFYRILLTDFTGQAIVVENSDPPAHIEEQAQVYMLSREARGHRFGFFPQSSSPAAPEG